MELYLMRHGQSENNARPEHLRVEDALLTQLGEQQANLLADWMETVELDRLFSSPFRRALQTTWPIYQKTGLPVQVLVPLHEVGGCVAGPGPEEFEGRPGIRASELADEFPGYLPAEEMDEDGWWKCQQPENEEQLHQRTSELLEWVQCTFAGSDEKVGCVMHADVTEHLLTHVARVIRDRPHRILYNTSVTRLNISEDRVTMELFNSIGHLPMSLTSR